MLRVRVLRRSYPHREGAANDASLAHRYSTDCDQYSNSNERHSSLHQPYKSRVPSALSAPIGDSLRRPGSRCSRASLSCRIQPAGRPLLLTLQDQLQVALGDSYSVERELPRGGMSRLFLATERALNRQVVVKLLPPELASELSAQRFQREMLLTAKLQHPHILPVLSAGARGVFLYYIMPYVRGESLRLRFEREGRLPIVESIRLLREIAEALAAAHAEGVVHRDVKPENVLLEHGHALLADFGIACARLEAMEGERLTGTGLGLGTPGYMAPEQLAGGRDVDGRADIYAL